MTSLRRAVNGRLMVSFAEFGLDPSRDAWATDLLRSLGFRPRNIDVVELAHARVGWGKFKENAPMAAAPGFVDCSSFVKWVYAIAGVWLPRLAVQQFDMGDHVHAADARPGDLIFTAGARNRFRPGRRDGIGHVGIIASNETVIHATQVGGVQTTAAAFFFDGPRYRRVRRVLPFEGRSVTLDIPKNSDVETSDDVFWILQDALVR